MAAPASVTYRFNGFRVDPARRLLFAPDGEPIPLRLKVFDVLLYLVEHPGELVAKEVLLESVWPHVVVEENNLNQAISTLRQVFGETRDQHRFIVTEPGRGYRFVAKVVVMPDASDGASGASPTRDQAGDDALVATPHKTRRARRLGLVVGAVALVVSAVVYALASGSIGERPAPAIGAAIRISPVTTYTGNEFGPAVSPDGSRVAFMWNACTSMSHQSDPACRFG